MEITVLGLMWLGLFIGGLPLLGWLLWWWNELWYVAPLKSQCLATGTKLPPGHMGFPLLGEMLSFLWYFKILRRPDEFINSKRRKYGDGVGMYRTHLFGSPSIMACFPSVNKFIFQSDDKLLLDWPQVDLMGPASLVAVHGKSHARLRSYVVNTINRPDALRRIALHVQPRMSHARLRSYVVNTINRPDALRRIALHVQPRMLTFENIGRLFASFEAGPLLDNMDNLFKGMIHGIRAYPINFPGTAYHHALQVVLLNFYMLNLTSHFTIFHLTAARSNIKLISYIRQCETHDLMDGLMQIRDEEGNKLIDQEVLDNIVSLVAAGYESTSLASMWALYYLSKFPNVLEKLREENMAISKNKKGDFLTSEDVSKMKYTNKVVEETIRMANIAAFVFRLAIKEVEYKGYKIPKDWKVIVWIRYIHTNPENFEDPMCFNPDRWNEPARPGTYQVFGGGSRICAGNMLARIQLALFLHHLSLGYKYPAGSPSALVHQNAD
ncbi:hypothetical protein FH972_018998 [Carpinus fangiana]|uniref:Ent-kaurenoic acid oxidase n=1 Tax=Carpinus fangiana TaxID=176857 RepID=A0A5N6RNY2_9ROSI|nr:hypothetical protein FH972_018998 [Carpinus fangiana]